MDGPAHLQVGQAGEDAALARYVGAGYRVVAQNWRCPLGELDLVLWRDGVLVFCEVKTRRGAGLGGPYEAVTWRKQRKLQQLAEAFLGASSLSPAEIRFDVASVTLYRTGRASLHVFESAF